MGLSFAFKCVIVCYYLLASLEGLSGKTTPDIRSLRVRSDVKYRFSTTLITSHAVNPYNTSADALFDVFLPDDAFISNFTMDIDGVIYPGNVKEKEEARKQYYRAKKRGQSAGLISKKPREANRFKVAITIAALGKVTFNLTYQELLKRTKGFYELKVYVNPGQVVEDMQIEVAVRESREITEVEAMTRVVDNDVYTDYTEAGIAIITQPDSETAFIKYFPSPEEQRQYSDDGLKGQFVVRYDIDRELDAGDVLVVNGYFVHFFAPKVQDRLPRDVIFIIDASGSMDGRKMLQVKEALCKILAEILEGERFNIMTFSSGGDDQRWFKDDLQYVTPETLQEALTFVNSIYARGGTDVHSALMAGIKQLTKNHDSKRALALLFLTDGRANTGVSNTKDILAEVDRVNEVGIPMFSLAFGHDADWDLVKKLSSENDGFVRKIYEDSDASLQIAGFYDELAVTLLKDVKIKYLDESVDEESVTRSDYRNYYKGSELVVAGKLEDNNTRHLNLEVLGKSIGGNLVLSTSADDVGGDFTDVEGQTKLEDFAEITEKTWAYLTIKQMLEKYKLADNATVKEELKERALELSLNYNFVTPLTSMVVTKPEAKINTNEEAESEADDSSGGRGSPAIRPTRWPATRWPATRWPATRWPGGGYGSGVQFGGRGSPATQMPGYAYTSGVQFGGRGSPATRRPGYAYGSGVRGDPHYMIRVRGVDHPICFDLQTADKKVYNVVNDPLNHIVINTEIVASSKLNRNGGKKTFIGRISIQARRHLIIMTPSAILFDTVTYSWEEDMDKQFGGNDFAINKMNHRMAISFRFGPEIVVERRLRSHRKNPDVDFLNMNIRNEDEFSRQTTGLLGQFVNGHKQILLMKQWNNNISGKTMAEFQTKTASAHVRQNSGDRETSSWLVFRANLVERTEMMERNKESCWMVYPKFYPLLFGDIIQFEMNDLLEN